MKKKIRISALDTLFFGDGRPFTMGDDSWSSDIFPPYPSTIYGMMRGVYFKENMAEYKEADDETNNPTKDLNILSFKLELKTKNNRETIYPLPLDIVKNESKKRFVALALQEKDTFISKYILSHQLVPQSEMATDKIRNTKGNYYITVTALIKYLANGEINSPIDKENELVFSLDKYLSFEPKIGISRDRYNTENKQLYRINQTRPESKKGKLNFLLEYDNIEIEDATYLSRMGGEGKLAFIEEDTISKDNIEKPIINEEEQAIVKMYLASPAIFEAGWEPTLDDGIEVIATAMGDIQNIGGWDAKLKQPRPMYKAVPAGSVYYLKGKKEVLAKFIATYHGKKLIQADNFANQGFGLVYFGKVKTSNK